MSTLSTLRYLLLLEMPEVESPIGDAKISTDDPTGSVVSVVATIGGFALMFLTLAYGRTLGDRMQRIVGNVTGVETDESGPGIEVV